MISSGLYMVFVWGGILWLFVGVLTIVYLAARDLPAMFRGEDGGGSAHE